MGKRSVDPECVLAPLPVVLVSCANKDGDENLLTIAWTGIINSNPPMTYISVRPSRFSHSMICETGEFVINLVNKDMLKAVDTCGVKSGKDTDKWALSGFTKAKAESVKASVVAQSPVNIECKVRQVVHLGSHDMFIADISAIQVDERFIKENGSLNLDDASLVAYVCNNYFELGKKIGTFGWSMRKKTLANRVKTEGKATVKEDVK